jgi:hypothetical protein
MSNLLDLKDLYTEALVRELTDKTNACGISWTQLAGNQFRSTYVDPDTNTWDYYVTKTQVGSLTYKYTFDVKKNGTTFATAQNGALPSTGRDSMINTLYETVETIVLEADVKLKEALNAIINITDCRSA